MPKAVKYILWLLVGLVLATFVYHKYEGCHQCGAVRHVFLTTSFFPNLFVEEGPLSDTYRQIVGEQCQHTACEPLTTWCFMFHADHVPKSPVFFTIRRELANLERLPKAEWQKQAILSIGDKENVLRWVAAMVLIDALGYQPPSSDAEWAEWWNENRSVFRIEKDPQRAVETARQAIERCSETAYVNCEYGIRRDLPDVKLQGKD